MNSTGPHQQHFFLGGRGKGLSSENPKKDKGPFVNYVTLSRGGGVIGHVTEVGGGGGGGGHTQSVTSHSFSHINFGLSHIDFVSVELNLCVLGVFVCSVAIICAVSFELHKL